jgi:hypothetical protein
VAAHRKTALSVRIAGTGSMVPERPVTTTELVAQVPGTWDAARVVARTRPGRSHRDVDPAAQRLPFARSTLVTPALPPRRSTHALRRM